MIFTGIDTRTRRPGADSFAPSRRSRARRFFFSSHHDDGTFGKNRRFEASPMRPMPSPSMRSITPRARLGSSCSPIADALDPTKLSAVRSPPPALQQRPRAEEQPEQRRAPHRGAPDVPHLEHARDPSGERLVRAVTRADRAPDGAAQRHARQHAVRAAVVRETHRRAGVFRERVSLCESASGTANDISRRVARSLSGECRRFGERNCRDALFAGSAPILGSPSSLGVTETQGSVFSRP